MEPQLDDATLVRRAQLGYLDAFELLVRRHRDQVYRVALRMLGSREDAEDAAQEAFVDAFQHLDRFRGDSAVSTWLYRITINRCLQHRRSRRPTVPLPDEHQLAGGPRPDELAETAGRREALLEAIARLPMDQRAALVLHQFERLSYEDAADVLEVSVSTVRGRIARARQQLLHQLRGWA